MMAARRVNVFVACGLALVAAALALPALSRAGAEAVRQGSREHLRVIFVGMQGHVDTFGFFPGNGGPPMEAVTTPDCRTGFPDSEAFRWGYGDPKRAGRLQTDNGAPLVLKSDNGSAFVAEALQGWLRAAGVEALFSPPRLPAYNGSCEAGIGALKDRTAARASRRKSSGHKVRATKWPPTAEPRTVSSRCARNAYDEASSHERLRASLGIRRSGEDMPPACNVAPSAVMPLPL